MKIEIESIGCVSGAREGLEDDYWGGSESCITLSDRFEPDALDGIEDYSHAEILYFFDRVHPSEIVVSSRRPRDNPDWPCVGIFAQRGKHRPNRIGSSMCRILRREGRHLFVSELDAVAGTSVLDIKPVMTEFLPRQAIRQPLWAHQLMSRYWERRPSA